MCLLGQPVCMYVRMYAFNDTCIHRVSVCAFFSVGVYVDVKKCIPALAHVWARMCGDACFQYTRELSCVNLKIYERACRGGTRGLFGVYTWIHSYHMHVYTHTKCVYTHTKFISYVRIYAYK